MKYYEKGYGVIPLGNHKNPIPKEWQHYSTEKITEKQIEAWIEQYPNAAIGLPCGTANNMIAVDIDIDDSGIRDIVPLSPVVRIGNPKRQTRLFRCPDFAVENKDFTGYDKDQPEYKSCKLVSILSSRRHTVIEGWHAKCKKFYTYPNFSLLDVDSLPVFTNDWFVKLQDYIQKNCPAKDGQKGFKTNGRNNTYTDIISAVLYRGESFEIAVKEILEEDAKAINPLFSDVSEGYPAKNEAETIRNAQLFAARHMAALCKDKNYMPFTAPKEKLVITMPQKTIEPEKKIKYPNDTSFISLFMNACKKRGEQDNPLYLAGAISTLGFIMSHRIQATLGEYTVSPNAYCFCVAGSGTGKGTALRVIKQIIDPKFLGCESYRSGPAFIHILKETGRILNIFNESSQLLDVIGSRESYKKELGEILCSVYDEPSLDYVPAFSKGDKDKVTVSQPHVSFIAMTTPIGFSESSNAANAENGLLARCIPFFLLDHKPIERDFATEKPTNLHDLKLWIENFNKAFPIDDAPNGKYFIREYKFTKEASDKYTEYYNYQLNNQTDKRWINSILNRKAQNASKVALIHAFSYSGQRMNQDVTLADMEWAIGVIDAMWSLAFDSIGETMAVNDLQKAQQRILSKLKEEGKMPHSKLLKHCCSKGTIFAREFKIVIDTLVQSDLIKIQKSDNPLAKYPDYVYSEYLMEVSTS